MSGISIASFLQPLNSYKNNNSANQASASLGVEEEKSSAFTLDLSDKAKQMMASASKINDLAKEDNSIPCLTKRVNEGTQNIQDRLVRMLLSHNIDYNGKNIEFETDESGRIRVKGDDIPDKEEIEALVNEDSQFSNDLKKLLNDSSMLATTEIQQKYKISLQKLEDEDKDSEENKLALHNKVIEFNKQIEAVSGSFSLNNGSLSVASMQLSASISFS